MAWRWVTANQDRGRVAGAVSCGGESAAQRELALYLPILLAGPPLLDDELFVYYGAADTVCCVATVKLQALLDLALRYRQ